MAERQGFTADEARRVAQPSPPRLLIGSARVELESALPL